MQNIKNNKLMRTIMIIAVALILINFIIPNFAIAENVKKIVYDKTASEKNIDDVINDVTTGRGMSSSAVSDLIIDAICKKLGRR